METGTLIIIDEVGGEINLELYKKLSKNFFKV